MIKILKSYSVLSSTVANIIKRQLKKHPLSKLGLPTGDTPLGMYSELIKEELDSNKYWKKYYDNWGSRVYAVVTDPEEIKINFIVYDSNN